MGEGGVKNLKKWMTSFLDCSISSAMLRVTKNMNK